MEGNGEAIVYAGGWSDYRSQRKVDTPEKVEKSKPKKEKVKQEKAPQTGLTFAEQKRLDALPARWRQAVGL